jgi:hypothetical protein
MSGLADVIEQAIRFPASPFVNVQSPLRHVRGAGGPAPRAQGGDADAASLGHDPADRLAAMPSPRNTAARCTRACFRDPAPRSDHDEAVRGAGGHDLAAPSRRDVWTASGRRSGQGATDSTQRENRFVWWLSGSARLEAQTTSVPSGLNRETRRTREPR